MQEGTSLVWRKTLISMQEGREVEGQSVIRINMLNIYYLGGSCPGMARDVKPRLEGLLSALFVLLNPAEVVKLSLAARGRNKTATLWLKIPLQNPRAFPRISLGSLGAIWIRLLMSNAHKNENNATRMRD